MTNRFDPDRARRFVGPDLGPTVCIFYGKAKQADKKVRTINRKSTAHLNAIIQIFFFAV